MMMTAGWPAGSLEPGRRVVGGPATNPVECMILDGGFACSALIASIAALRIPS